MLFDDDDFYPITRELGFRLTDGLRLNQYSSVLEPSGGGGHLADHIRARMGIFNSQTDPAQLCGSIGKESEAANEHFCS